MTELEKFELWASSIGLPAEYYSYRYAWEAWQEAKQQAHCEALADLHKLEQKVSATPTKANR